MATAKNKTVETKNSVDVYLKKIRDEQKRRDCSDLISFIGKNTKFEPKVWGSAIVGFGSYHYKYESGREGDAPLMGLSARANAIAIYIGKFKERDSLLKKLGKHKLSGGCLYIQKLADIDTAVLNKMMKLSIANTKKTYPDKKK